MKNKPLAVALLAGLSLMAPGLRAFDYAGKWSISGFGGFDTLAMGDVNNTLSQWGGSISNGWEAGLGLGYGLGSKVMVNLGVSEIFNQASFRGGNITLPALSFLLSGEYVFLPEVMKDFDLGLAGGVEYDWLDGSTSVDLASKGPGVASTGLSASSWGGGGGGAAPSGTPYTVTNCQGQTVGAQLSLKGKYFISPPNWALGLEAGYRYSHIYSVTGTTNGVSGPESETVDYSGFISKLSLAYYF